MTQFMQVSMFNHKSTESTIKNLEIQVGHLAKQIAENSSGSFGANNEKNPKEECKAVVTRSQRRVIVDDESQNNEGELGVDEGKEREGDETREKEISENEEAENEEKNKKREIEGAEKKEVGDRRTKSELVRERKKEAIPNSGKEAPYPLVPSKKYKE